jgi:hypothetical protein
MLLTEHRTGFWGRTARLDALADRARLADLELVPSRIRHTGTENFRKVLDKFRSSQDWLVETCLPLLREAASTFYSNQDVKLRLVNEGFYFITERLEQSLSLRHPRELIKGEGSLPRAAGMDERFAQRVTDHHSPFRFHHPRDIREGA